MNGATKNMVMVVAMIVAASMMFTGQARAAVSAPSTGGTLYVQQAGGGTLVKGSGGVWHLTLSRPDVRTTTFSDRPQRVAGSMPLAAFISSWRRNFGSDRPNAALEIAPAPSSRDVALLELGPPRYDRVTDTLTFAVKPLRSTDDRALASFERRSDRGLHGAFGRASLFIDDGGPSNLLTFSLTGLTAPDAFEIDLGGAQFTFGPSPTFLVQREAALAVGLARHQLLVSATGGVGEVTGSIPVVANPAEPLEIQFSLPAGVTASASWAGGPTVALPPPGSAITLPAAP